MTMHDKWTDQLSEYIDGELTPAEHAAVESHLQGCPACLDVLNDLKRVIARAQAAEPRPPQADLWRGVAARIGAGGTSRLAPFRAPAGRRFAFTLPQLAAASLLIAVMSGGLAWSVADRAAKASRAVDRDAAAVSASARQQASDERAASVADGAINAVSLADAQYDAAVADLERALKQGRGRLDPSTIAAVEHNLETIDQAIQQAREALAGDPANTYLSSHLIEARRRKLDLLRRAAALTIESD